MKISKTRLYGTDINIVKVSKQEIRLDTTVGVPGKREDIRFMFGNPKLDEVTCLRYNLSFFDTANPASEELGAGRGDNFVNVGYDGKNLSFEPNIPANRVWEAPSAYMLLRDGKYDYLGQEGLKSIIGANPRTMYGQDASNIYVMIAEGRKLGQKGLTADEQRAVCSSLGLVDACNADGGGSSVAFVYDLQIGKVWDYRKHGRIIVGYSKYKLEELPTIKSGSKGVYVNLLQRHLNISADGIFGKGTKAAVVAFQKSKKLAADGIVGKQTWTALTAAQAPKAVDKIPVVLAASQQRGNKCAVCSSEQEHMHKIFDIVESKLEKDPQLDVYKIPVLTQATQTERLSKLIELSNKFVASHSSKKKYHISGHSDAFNGKDGGGASVFWYKDGSDGEKLGRAIWNELCKLTPWTDRFAQARPELWELRKTIAIACLLEVSFHDQLDEAKWIHDNMENIAECFVAGFYKGAGLTRPPASTDEADAALAQALFDLGAITDKEYWTSVFNGTATLNLKYVKIAFKNLTSKL